MKFIKKNPRKSVFIGTYLIIFLLTTFVFRVGSGALALVYLAATAALIVIFFSTVLALIGNYLYASGKTENAVRFLEFAIKRDTPSPTAYINYSIYLIRNGNGEKALDCLKTAGNKNPDVMAMKNIDLTTASCHWSLGHPDKARDLLEDMRKRYDYVNAHVLSTLGYMYFALGDDEKALEFTNLALEDTPALAAAWDNLGQIYLRQGKTEDAKINFLKALEHKANLPDSLFHLGLIAEREGLAEEARAYYEKAIACEITALNTVSRKQIEDCLKNIV